MLFQTTQAHEELRAKVRAFAEEEIKPIAFMLDQQNEFPDEAIRKLGEIGLMGIPFPAEYGGAGLDALSYAIAVEELARVDGGAGVILSAHVSLGSWPIFAYGTEEQKRKYLVPLAKGEKIGAFGLTEPNAGSDAGGTETTAVLKGDHFQYLLFPVCEFHKKHLWSKLSHAGFSTPFSGVLKRVYHHAPSLSTDGYKQIVNKCHRIFEHFPRLRKSKTGRLPRPVFRLTWSPCPLSPAWPPPPAGAASPSAEGLAAAPAVEAPAAPSAPAA